MVIAEEAENGRQKNGNLAGLGLIFPKRSRNTDTYERSGGFRDHHDLEGLEQRNTAAGEKLLPFVYDELKRQARILMSRERPNHTLQPTALVHEAFMRLARKATSNGNRAHFYGISARLMRQILSTTPGTTPPKRGSNAIHFSSEDIDIPVEQRADSILIVDEVLGRLAAIDEQQASIVEMRFFGGLTNAEIAEALGISERTVVREWQSARLWLYRELNKT